MVNFSNKRQIHSFVRREGRITPGQRRALEVLWPRYGINFHDQVVDLNAVFERAAPCVLEIGFGNGEALAQTATANPHLNFLGIEVHRPGVGHLLQLLDKNASSNVRVICHDAVEFLQTSAVPGSFHFRQISVFFPDPWPKKRHHKRRLIQHDVVGLLTTLLEDGGILHIATDWEDYAAHITGLIVHQCSLHEAPLSSALPRPGTRFETKGRNKGHRVLDLVYQKHP